MKNVEELVALCKGLPSIPDEHFDMRVWRRLEPDQKLGDCGTAACAIGWLPLIYPNTGLGFARSDFRSEQCYWPCPVGVVYQSVASKNPYQIVADYFDITLGDAEHLFDSTEYRLEYDHEDEDEDIPPVTAIEVAERLKEYLKGKGVHV